MCYLTIKKYLSNVSAIIFFQFVCNAGGKHWPVIGRQEPTVLIKVQGTQPAVLSTMAGYIQRALTEYLKDIKLWRMVVHYIYNKNCALKSSDIIHVL